MADLIISQPMRFTVDVKNGLVERPQRESLMRGDKMANRIIAELVYGSEPFDITGVTVKGKFCRPPSGDEIDLAGEAKGNVAEVQLTDQCYTSGGHYEARVILVLGGVERTVLFISGDVLKSGSGNAAGDESTGGSGGSTGSGLPAGGTAGQVLVKVSSAQGDAVWKTLTAADVGARPDNWTPTAEETGALPKEGTAKDSEKLGGVEANMYALKTDIPEGDTSGGTVTGVKIGDETFAPDGDGMVDMSSMTAPNANQLNGKSADQYVLKNELPSASSPLDAFPVGSIYMSVNETSPASLFGGSWTQIAHGRTLIGMGSIEVNDHDYWGSVEAGSVNPGSAGEKGGSAWITLKENNLPARTMVLESTTKVGDIWCAGKWGNTHGAATGDNIANYAQGSSYGYAQAISNMPPYMAVYMWERVS